MDSLSYRTCRIATLAVPLSLYIYITYSLMSYLGHFGFFLVVVTCNTHDLMSLNIVAKSSQLFDS